MKKGRNNKMVETLSIKEALVLLFFGLFIIGIKEVIRTEFNIVEVVFTMFYFVLLVSFIAIFRDSISRLWTKCSIKEKTKQRRLAFISIIVLGFVALLIFLWLNYKFSWF